MRTLEMNDGRTAPGNIRVIERRLVQGFGASVLRMMGTAYQRARQTRSQPRSAFSQGEQSPRRESSQHPQRALASSGLPPPAASSQLAKRSALTPLMRSIARRSSSTVRRRRASRIRARSALATNARSAFSAPPTFEVGRGRKSPPWQEARSCASSTSFQSPRPRYSRFRIPAAGCLLDRTQPWLSAWANTFASAIQRARSQ